ncbi:MAG: hypothetical protein JEZ00_04995 [Anaerolineaceae bacterium]|nr:hypothetical protein [Anaerolineaceae bacterium]
MNSHIPRIHKYLFWLTLGLISTFFAEVISSADLFPFFHTWGIFLIVPSYLLHTVVLTTLIFRFGRPTLPVLYFTGTIFGLYEAYITKILWNPIGEDIIKLGEVAVFEVLVLVFFWHAWMSFIVPLLVSEKWLTGSTDIRSNLQRPIQKLLTGHRGWIFLAIGGGFFVSIQAPSVSDALLSTAGSALVLGFSGWLWQRLTRNRQNTIEDLLPNRRELFFLLTLLIGFYIWTGFYLRPEAYPPLMGHVIIWILYTLCILFLIIALKASRSQINDTIIVSSIPLPSRFLWLKYLLVYVLTLIIAITILKPLSGLIGLIGWFGVGILGLISLIWMLRSMKLPS